MSLATQQQTFTDPAFQGRIQSAAMAQALAVFAEGAAVSDHAARLALANRFMAEPRTGSPALLSITLAAVVGDALSTSSVDADISARIAAVWSAVGGIAAGQAAASPAGPSSPTGATAS